ncbi:MAG: acyl-CoA dehydrogenase family protein, partial [Nocardioides sp.]
MSAPTRHGVSSRDHRDPIGYAVAAMNKLAQSDLLDRLGIRRQAEKAVFTVTRSGFRTATVAGRAFARAGQRGRAGTRPSASQGRGVFDLTPSEDEQMLVDVVTEFADEIVRPAAAEADETCTAPEALLKSSLEIGLPILGVPESLGGISEERSAMAGTLVAEALAKG